MTSSFDENFFPSSQVFKFLGTERSHTGLNPENRVDEESIHSFVIATVVGTARCLDGRALFCAPISLQMTTRRELCVLSG